ncbi:MAG TPA: lysophospholipid acyltransferase family protein [Nevskiaceae bacterium]|nr:lysophospholipid acyltransferase family protein [Nevskiaceae bacterium]
MNASLRFVGRTLRLLVHLGTGLLLASLLRLDRSGRLRMEPLMEFWLRRLLRILGIELCVQGEPLRGGHVQVANHVSWLDIPVLGAGRATHFIAKSEIRDWPVAGFLATAIGTFYLRRGKGGAKPLLARLTPFLQGGGRITLFPEGTTTDGRDVLGFHPRLLAAAVEAQVPVQPVVLRYGRGDGGADLAPFIGEDDLVSHILRLLRNRHLQVRLDYLPALQPAAFADRDALALAAEQAVRAVLRPGSALPAAARHRVDRASTVEALPA